MCACSHPLPGSLLVYASHQPAQNAIASRVAKSTSADFPDRDFWLEITCGVEMWRGGLGAAYLLPALSSAGASLASPCFRFHIPLIEPDGRISRVRLSEKGSRCRPREMARPPAKADQTQHVV